MPSDYDTRIYRPQGGDSIVVSDGGTITVESGGTVTVQAGATFAVHESATYSVPGGSTTVTESTITLSDVTTGNASTSRHGFLPKLSGNAGQFLNGSGTFSSATTTVTESTITLSDVTTGNASTSRHGFAPKLSGDATTYLDGSGAFSTPTATASAGGSSGQLQVNSGGSLAGAVVLTYSTSGTRLTIQTQTDAEVPLALQFGPFTRPTGNFLEFRGNTGSLASAVNSTGNFTGNADNVTGIVAIANGGTSADNAVDARNNLLPAQIGNAGKLLTTDGANASWDTPAITPTPGGSSGQLQYNDAGTMAGTTGVTYAATGPLLSITAQTATDTPLTLKGAASQSGNYLNVRDNADALIASINASGAYVGNVVGNVTGSVSGTAANVTGIVAIANGGTSADNAVDARNALLPAQTGASKKYLQTDGTNAGWSNLPAVISGDDTTLGMFGATPVIRQSANQALTDSTSGTASTTLGNPALNDSTGGTASTALASVSTGTGADTALNDNFASIAASLVVIQNALATLAARNAEVRSLLLAYGLGS